jgi:hypothetical protein
MPRYRVQRVDGHTTIWSRDMESAQRRARAWLGEGHAPAPYTRWVTGQMWALGADGDPIGRAETVRLELPATEPRCSTADGEHDWQHLPCEDDRYDVAVCRTCRETKTTVMDGAQECVLYDSAWLMETELSTLSSEETGA